MEGTKSPEKTLALFAKWPEPGLVKSRLAKDTNENWACKVATAFLQDMISKCDSLPYNKILAYSPEKTEQQFSVFSHSHFSLHPQGTGSLGERLSAFVNHHWQMHGHPLVILGTDSPSMPIKFVHEAFELLESHDVVLGPATDGGYYLIGMSKSVPQLFKDIPWSTSAVLYKTIQIVSQKDFSLACLPPWYDVDTLDDWQLFVGHTLASYHMHTPIDFPKSAALALDWQRNQRSEQKSSGEYPDGSFRT